MCDPDGRGILPGQAQKVCNDKNEIITKVYGGDPLDYEAGS